MARPDVLSQVNRRADLAHQAELTESALARAGYLAAIIALFVSGPVMAAAIGSAALYAGIRSDQNGRKASILEHGNRYDQPRGFRRLLRP